MADLGFIHTNYPMDRMELRDSKDSKESQKASLRNWDP